MGPVPVIGGCCGKGLGKGIKKGFGGGPRRAACLVPAASRRAGPRASKADAVALGKMMDVALPARGPCRSASLLADRGGTLASTIPRGQPASPPPGGACSKSTLVSVKFIPATPAPRERRGNRRLPALPRKRSLDRNFSRDQAASRQPAHGRCARNACLVLLVGFSRQGCAAATARPPQRCGLAGSVVAQRHGSSEKLLLLKGSV